MLGQAGRLSERQRVKPRLSLFLIRIRYFVVSLIPWSEARSRPPSPQNTFENRPCFRTFFMRTLVNFIAELQVHIAEGKRKRYNHFICMSEKGNGTKVREGKIADVK